MTGGAVVRGWLRGGWLYGAWRPIRWTARRLRWAAQALLIGTPAAVVIGVAAWMQGSEPSVAAIVAATTPPATPPATTTEPPADTYKGFCPNGTYELESEQGPVCVDAQGTVHERETQGGKTGTEPPDDGEDGEDDPPITTSDPDALPPEVYVVESCKGAAAGHRLSIEVVGRPAAFNYQRKDCGDSSDGQSVHRGGAMIWNPDTIHQRNNGENSTYFRPPKDGEAPEWSKKDGG